MATNLRTPEVSPAGAAQIEVTYSSYGRGVDMVVKSIAAGYTFLRWVLVESGGRSGTYTYTTQTAHHDLYSSDSSFYCVAYFQKGGGGGTGYWRAFVSLIADPDGAGTLSVNGTGYSQAFSYYAPLGTNIPVRVTATPNPGYKFKRWNPLSGTGSTAVMSLDERLSPDASAVVLSPESGNRQSVMIEAIFEWIGTGRLVFDDSTGQLLDDPATGRMIYDGDGAS